MGYPDKAIETYDEGIKRFPDSGRLHFEKAIVYLSQNNLKEAVANWETAVNTEPDYSSSYYYLAKYYSLHSESVWALIYGEIFCNLEKNSKRTLEISKLLYDTYSKTINFNEGKTNIDVQITANPENLDYLTFLMNYGIVSSLSTIDVEKNFNLANLIKIRKNFLSIWEQKGFLDDYPIVLLDWHQDLIDKGYFEAYNYWLFNAGNKDEFNAWYDSNESKFHDFDSWCSKNHIGVNTNNYFSKSYIKKLIKEKSK
jgi:tetratricopeptide (TPR) repeat protein